jgi:multiple sugar transport system substrate-binding protein
MKDNSNLVQTIVLIVCVLGIILGILFFSGKIKLPWDKAKQNALSGSVTMWGIMPYSTMKTIFDAIQANNQGLRITYVEKKPETIQTELVNALASGKGPDIFMMGPGQVAQNLDRLSIIPYANYPDTVYRNTFADISNDFMTVDGIIAFPLYIDPMVMYYNRDMLSSIFVVDPPTTWEELAALVPILTKKDDAGKIIQSTVALGTTNNTSYAKDILVLRMLQSGNPIVQENGKTWSSVVDGNGILGRTLQWFVSFAMVNSPVYSWNQSLPQDRDAFAAGNTAFYFGYPSEVYALRQKNPNLNFDYTMVPQFEGAKIKADYGRVYSIGITKISKNLPAAVGVANLLTSKEIMSQYVPEGYFAPARRDLLSDKPRNDAHRVIIYNSAIISKTFFDPDASGTNRLFVNAINQINAGTKTVDNAQEPINSGFRDLVDKIVLPDAPLQ